jgi:ribosomal protein L12E/L44/L45/RPP1/RPP2
VSIRGEHQLLDAPAKVVQAAGMDADEREIFDYLKTFGEEWVNAKEICRRAGGKRRYHEDNNWAKPILHRMKEQHILEGDELGRFRIKPPPKKGHKGRWVSPDIQKILNESGVQVDADRADAATDEHYEQL